MKKILYFLFLVVAFLLLISVYSVVNASTEEKIEIIKKSTSTESLTNEGGTIKESILSVDQDKKEVTVQLTLDNNIQKQTFITNSEIFFVLDNSSSMSEAASGGLNRKKTILNSAKDLLNDLFETNTNFKVGLITFQSTPIVRQALTDNKETMLTALNNESNISPTGGTIIATALDTAKKNFSKDENTRKIIVLLSDGIPGDEAATKTIFSLFKNMDIYTIAILIKNNNTSSSEEEHIKNVFGTPENPNTNKLHRTTDTDISESVCNYLSQNFNRIITTKSDFKQATITFPQNILDNFDIVCDEEFDNQKITWNINDSSSNETSLTYKLVLKDNYDKNIINEIMQVSNQVSVTYDRIKNKVDSQDIQILNNNSYTLLDSPEIKITTIVKENPTENNTTTNKTENNVSKTASVTDNTTVTTKKLPQTGDYYSVLFITLLLIVTGYVLIIYKKFRKLG